MTETGSPEVHAFIERRGASSFEARFGFHEGEHSMTWIFSLWDHDVLLVCTGAAVEMVADKAISHRREGPVRR